MADSTAIEKSPQQEIQVKSQTPRAVAWTYRPNVDIFDAPDEILLVADMPGASSEHINVAVEAGILTLQAQVEPRSNGGRRTVLHEYGVGNFHRRFEIDSSIDPEGISAEYRHGTLTVHLPKAQQARRRRIPISS